MIEYGKKGGDRMQEWLDIRSKVIKNTGIKLVEAERIEREIHDFSSSLKSLPAAITAYPSNENNHVNDDMELTGDMEVMKQIRINAATMITNSVMKKTLCDDERKAFTYVMAYVTYNWGTILNGYMKKLAKIAKFV